MRASVLIATLGSILAGCGEGDVANPTPVPERRGASVVSPRDPVASPRDPVVSSSAPPPPRAGNVTFTAEEIAAMKQLSPLPEVPPDPTNAFADDAGAAALGHKLFFDPRLSGPLRVTSDLGTVGDTAKVSCVTCHSSTSSEDPRWPRNVSLGTDWGARKALPIANSSFYRWSNWGGLYDSQWSLVLGVVENPKVMNGTRLQIVHLLYDSYRIEYEAVFPSLDPALNHQAPDAARFPPTGKPKASPGDPDGAWEAMTTEDQVIVDRVYANFGKAVAAYLRLNVRRNAPFDKFVAGDDRAISDDAKAGLRIFLGKGRCVVCHSGPNFSDDQFHDEGLPQTGAHVGVDDGRAKDLPTLIASPWNSEGMFSDDRTTKKLIGLMPRAADAGAFRTKSLRNLRNAGPYMHAGQLADLDLVVHFYSSGGAPAPIYGWQQTVSTTNKEAAKDPLLLPLGLTPLESSALVAFLDTLEGEPL